MLFNPEITVWLFQNQVDMRKQMYPLFSAFVVHTKILTNYPTSVSILTYRIIK
jgi:hypothetical protein